MSRALPGAIVPKMEVIVDGKVEERAVSHVEVDSPFGRRGARYHPPHQVPVHSSNERVMYTIGGGCIVVPDVERPGSEPIQGVDYEHWWR